LKNGNGYADEMGPGMETDERFEKVSPTQKGKKKTGEHFHRQFPCQGTGIIKGLMKQGGHGPATAQGGKTESAQKKKLQILPRMPGGGHNPGPSKRIHYIALKKKKGRGSGKMCLLSSVPKKTHRQEQAF